MTKQLVIASNNEGKIKELREMLPFVELVRMKDIGYVEEIAEPFRTFEENALAKASAIHGFSGQNVFSDDSGICVPALNGEPGVDSAHYSGDRDDEKNLQKLLQEIKDKEDKSAYYKAVICLVWEDETYYFEGICNGHIINEKRGDKGFGYDPIFIPEGYEQTFGELDADVKNSISHRGKAVEKMVAFLKEKISREESDEIFDWG